MAIQTNSHARLWTLIIIAIFSAIVMIAHYAGVGEITQLSEEEVSMKLSTAFMFSLTSLLLICQVKELFCIIPTLATCVFFSMINCGMECVFPSVDTSMAKSIAIGFPSYATLLSFFIIGSYPVEILRRVTGFLLMLIGACALIGYLTGNEELYYHFEGESTAMAILTALFIFLFGFIFIMDSKAT